jgi:hypothetical protein
MNDPIGRAIADFYANGEAPDIKIQTNYTEGELLSPAYFFRKENEMPEIDKTALELCRGKVLDVGAAAGCHALMLQEKGLEVVALGKIGTGCRGDGKTWSTKSYLFKCYSLSRKRIRHHSAFNERHRNWRYAPRLRKIANSLKKYAKPKRSDFN